MRVGLFELIETHAHFEEVKCLNITAQGGMPHIIPEDAHPRQRKRSTSLFQFEE